MNSEPRYYPLGTKGEFTATLQVTAERISGATWNISKPFLGYVRDDVFQKLFKEAAPEPECSQCGCNHATAYELGRAYERQRRETTLQWVKEEIITEIADMGGDPTRRKWWNEAANILWRKVDAAIAHPELTTSEELSRIERQEAPNV